VATRGLSSSCMMLDAVPVLFPSRAVGLPRLGNKSLDDQTFVC
jgi:hypothetical protein